MNKKILFFLLLLSLVFISKGDEVKNSTNEEQEVNNNSNIEEKGEDMLRESLKKLLISRDLFDKNAILSPEQVREIFIEIITDGDPTGSPQYVQQSIGELADHFVDLYYQDRRELRAKELYDLFDVNQISEKFEQLLGLIPVNDDDDVDDHHHNVGDGNGIDDDDKDDDDKVGGEENDYDKRDVVGEPTEDV